MKTIRTTPPEQLPKTGQKVIASPSIPLRIECRHLSHEEKDLLQTHEETITEGLATFFEVGSALMAIKEARLYREKHSSFEAYCQQRWGFGRTYAWRVIGAAERLKLLNDEGTTRKPSSEFQMRPFLRLAPEAFPNAWKQVLERAKDGEITSKLIGRLIEEAETKKARKKNSVPPRKLVGLKKSTIGEIIVLLYRVRRHIEQVQPGEPERAIEHLERIEKLLTT
jgi:hypothetical protein